jgi:hypothetical protein
MPKVLAILITLLLEEKQVVVNDESYASGKAYACAT